MHTLLVRALKEGEDNRYLKTVATCKHFIDYDLKSWDETTRWDFDVQVSDQDLVETYLLYHLKHVFVMQRCPSRWN